MSVPRQEINENVVIETLKKYKNKWNEMCVVRCTRIDQA